MGKMPKLHLFFGCPRAAMILKTYKFRFGENSRFKFYRLVYQLFLWENYSAENL